MTDALAGRDGPEVTAALLALVSDKSGDVRMASVRVLAGKSGAEVTAALLALLDDHDRTLRVAAARALEGREEAVILMRLTRPGAWLIRPTLLRERFDLANAVADRTYLRVPKKDRARIRRRLGNITQRIGHIS